jgi:hypothetical protein
MAEKEERWTEHFAKGFEALCEELQGTVPKEFKMHVKNSMKELLLAIDSLLKKGIERLEEKEEKVKKPRKVEVK